jgi:alpha-1,2-mannosyltransferase
MSVLILAGSDHTVVTTYREAATQWMAGRDLYNDTGHGFLYLPIAAVLFAPFSWLPPVAGEIAWRLVAIGGFAFGVYRLCSIAEVPQKATTFALLTAASLPPALACARNGQSTLIMAGLMMIACVDLAERRRNRAVLCASLAVALKPLAVVLLLLFPFLDRRIGARVVLGLGTVLCLPFLMQRPSYVLDQYVKCGQMFRASSHCGVIELWAQPFSVLGLLGVSVAESTQTVLRAGAGLGALALTWAARRRCVPPRAAEYLLAISVLYILLFNPRTENNTYAMLGPVIGLALAAALASKLSNRGEIIFLATLLVLLAAGDAVIRIFAAEGEHVWLSPSVATVFSIYLMYRLFFRERERMAKPTADPECYREVYHSRAA